MTSRLPLHQVTSDDDVMVTSSPDAVTTSGDGAPPSVLKTSGRQAPANPLSIGYVIAAIVLGLMCLILGLVYGYIYFTRISPRFRTARLFDHGGRVDGHNSSTHIFLRNSKSIQALWRCTVECSWKVLISGDNHVIFCVCAACTTRQCRCLNRPQRGGRLDVWDLHILSTDSLCTRYHQQQQMQHVDVEWKQRFRRVTRCFSVQGLWTVEKDF